MSDFGVVGAARVVLDRCVALEAEGGVPARLKLVRGLEDLVLAAQVAQARVLAGLVVHEAAEFAPYAITGPTGQPGTVPSPGAVTPQEIAACLDMSVESVRMRLAVADTLIGVLPAVSAAAEVGQLRWWQVRRTVEAVWGLPAGVVPALDARIAELAGQGRLRTRFGDTLAGLVISLDPELAERRLEVALAERGVAVRPEEGTPGMGVLIARLPAEGAITVAACLDRLADTALSVPPDGLPAQGRTVDARRADALVGLAATVLDAFDAYSTTDTGPDTHRATEQPCGVTVAVGAPAGCATDPGLEQPCGVTVALEAPAGSAESAGSAEGAAAAPGTVVSAAVRAAGLAGSTGRGNVAPRRSGRVRRSGEIRVTVSAETLLGVRDHPGELTGWGPITAAHARRLAQRLGTVWRRILTDPASGAVLDIGRTRYPAGAAITDHVLARDGGRCTRPGCSHAGRDLDHAQAWADGGTTAVGNLHAVCRGCHSVKHLGWTVAVAPDGTISWETPHGHRSQRLPPDLRPEDRLPPPPGHRHDWITDLTTDLRHAQAAATRPTRPPPGDPVADDPEPPPL